MPFWPTYIHVKIGFVAIADAAANIVLCPKRDLGVRHVFIPCKARLFLSGHEAKSGFWGGSVVFFLYSKRA